jgi:hypothetical protein
LLDCVEGVGLFRYDIGQHDSDQYAKATEVARAATLKPALIKPSEADLRLTQHAHNCVTNPQRLTPITTLESLTRFECDTRSCANRR